MLLRLYMQSKRFPWQFSNTLNKSLKFICYNCQPNKYCLNVCCVCCLTWGHTIIIIASLTNAAMVCKMGLLTLLAPNWIIMDNLCIYQLLENMEMVPKSAYHHYYCKLGKCCHSTCSMQNGVLAFLGPNSIIMDNPCIYQLLENMEMVPKRA